MVILASPEASRPIAEGLGAARCVQAPPHLETGLRAAEGLRPALVLLDAASVESGAEALVLALRRSPALSRTPLVVLTGGAEDALRAQLLKAGAHDWLTVPCTPEELSTRVSNVLAAQRARDAQSLVASLVEQAPDGTFVADPGARYTDVNEAGCRLLGYARDELLGKTILDLIPPEDVPRLADSKARLLSGQVHVATWRLRHKDGTFIPVEVSATILPDGRWQGFVRDVRERERTEAALRRAEAVSSGIVLTSVYAIACIDRHQRVTLFNHGAERLFGYAAAEMLGQPLSRLLPERSRARHEREVRDFLGGQESSRTMDSHRTPLFGLRKSGEEVPIEAAISKVSVHGEEIGTVALRDISEERRAEAEQRTLAEVGAALACLDAAQRLKNLVGVLVRSVGDFASVFLMGDEPPTLERAAVASRVPAQAWAVDVLLALPLGPRPEHLVWRAVETLGPVMQSIDPRRYGELAQSPEHLRALEASHVRSALAAPLVLAGRCVGVVTLASQAPSFERRDLTLVEEIARRCVVYLENARLFRAQKRAVEARDQVLSIVAHDLRNPLNAIVLQAGQLKRYGEPERHSQRSAEAISNAAPRMDRIIEDLLDVTRLEAGLFTLDRAVLPADELLASVVASQSALASARGLVLEVTAPERLPLVWADRERVFQVFENLVGNAAKCTPRGGKVTLGAEEAGAEVRFWVSDTGAGIRPEHLPRLFDRFWQADTHHRGAGLGLSIVKGIVDAHGGRLWVDSEVGRGSTLSFTLPEAGPAEPDLGDGARPVEPDTARGGLVLVAKDDADTREALSELLRGHGYRVEAVENGALALARLREGLTPRAVVIDLAMPELDGWGFLAARAKDPRLARVPVIVASGQRGVEARVLAQHASFLAKPVSEARLFDLLASLGD